MNCRLTQRRISRGRAVAVVSGSFWQHPSKRGEGYLNFPQAFSTVVNGHSLFLVSLSTVVEGHSLFLEHISTVVIGHT